MYVYICDKEGKKERKIYLRLLRPKLAHETIIYIFLVCMCLCISQYTYMYIFGQLSEMYGNKPPPFSSLSISSLSFDAITEGNNPPPLFAKLLM